MPPVSSATKPSSTSAKTTSSSKKPESSKKSDDKKSDDKSDDKAKKAEEAQAALMERIKNHPAMKAAESLQRTVQGLQAGNSSPSGSGIPGGISN